MKEIDRIKSAFSLNKRFWLVLLFDFLFIASILFSLMVYSNLIGRLAPLVDQIASLGNPFTPAANLSGIASAGKELQIKLIVYHVISVIILLALTTFTKATAYLFAAGKKMKRTLYYLRFLGSNIILIVGLFIVLGLIQFLFYKWLYFDLAVSTFAEVMYFISFILVMYLAYVLSAMFLLCFTKEERVWKGMVLFGKEFISIRKYWRSYVVIALIFAAANLLLSIALWIPPVVALLGTIIYFVFGVWVKIYLASVIGMPTGHNVTKNDLAKDGVAKKRHAMKKKITKSAKKRVHVKK